MNKSFEKACDLIGAANMARYLGVTPQAINEWKKGKRPVPVDRCADIERATGGKVTRRDLRPDDWERIWPELADQSPANPEEAEALRESKGPMNRTPPDPSRELT